MLETRHYRYQNTIPNTKYQILGWDLVSLTNPIALTLTPHHRWQAEEHIPLCSPPPVEATTDCSPKSPAEVRLNEHLAYDKERVKELEAVLGEKSELVEDLRMLLEQREEQVGIARPHKYVLYVKYTINIRYSERAGKHLRLQLGYSGTYP